jgi:hypothetical protein
MSAKRVHSAKDEANGIGAQFIQPTPCCIVSLHHVHRSNLAANSQGTDLVLEFLTLHDLVAGRSMPDQVKTSWIPLLTLKVR